MSNSPTNTTRHRRGDKILGFLMILLGIALLEVPLQFIDNVWISWAYTCIVTCTAAGALISTGVYIWKHHNK